MKKRSGRNLIRFFYHLLVVLVMAMPMLSGLVRVIYVQSNKNAKDSYYGENINEKIITSSSIYGLDTNINYEFIYSYVPQSFETTTSPFSLLVSNFSSDTTLDNNGATFELDSVNRIWFGNNLNYFVIRFYNDNESGYYSCNGTFSNIDFKFRLTSNVYINNNYLADFIGNRFYSYLYNDYSFLDNAFDYSIWKTMQDFTFHSDFRFTDIANGMLMTFDNDNLYVKYINFYINWVLTCAVISFAPYVLLTFYHLAIGLLDKFMKKGEDF